MNQAAATPSYTTDLINALPLVVLSCAAVLLLLLEAFSRVQWVGKTGPSAPHEASNAFVVAAPGTRYHFMVLCSLSLLAAIGLALWQWTGFSRLGVSAVPVFQHMLQIDRFGLAAFLLCAVASLSTVWIAPLFLRSRRIEIGEFYPLVLLALCGAYILIFAADFVSLFLGLEILSLAVYVLTALWRRSTKSSEAGMKYFIMGGFFSALLLYGVALLYGVTKTTQFDEMRLFFEHTPSGTSLWIALVGCILVLCGLLFKWAAVPLHMWAPDVYEGAPTPVSAFMMTVVKCAAVAALWRLASGLFLQKWLEEPLSWFLYACAVGSVLLGNILALRQDNLKRMLGYSSVAHAGYLLIGILAAGKNAAQAGTGLLVYLVGYVAAILVALGCIVRIEARSTRIESYGLEEFAGLGKRKPALACCLTLALLSLAGFPPTLGFFGKFYLFRLASEAESLRPLVIVALLSSVVGIGYYFRVIMTLYFKEPSTLASDTEMASVRTTRKLMVPVAWVLILGAAVTLLLGLFPNPLVQWLSSGIISKAAG